MDIARAMALGKIVYAEDCDFSSYTKLGLLCTVCKEPVYLRAGEIRKSHFAHFKGTDPRLVEECELRVTAYSTNTVNTSSIEDRGQRLETFQKHFLNMIYLKGNKIIDDSKFKKWIDLFKQANNELINNFTKPCTEYFIMHRESMQEKYILPKAEIKEKYILLDQEIALEAMNYLCVKSSFSLLEYILQYSMYQLHYQTPTYTLLKQLNTEEKIKETCLFATEMIIFNPWLKAFSNPNSIKSNLKNSHLSTSAQTQCTVILNKVQKKSKDETSSNKVFPHVSFEYPSRELMQSVVKHNGVAVTVKITETQRSIKRESLYFYTSLDGGVLIRNDEGSIVELQLDAKEGLKTIKNFITTKKRKYSYINGDTIESLIFLSELSKNTKYINTELGADWVIPALRVFPVMRIESSATTYKIIYATVEDWIKAISESESNADVVKYIIDNGNFTVDDALILQSQFIQ